MHDEIGSSLTQVAILSEVMKKRKDNPEEMTKLIDKISGIAGSLVDEMSDIIWAMNPKNDNLASFTSYVRQHVSEYLVSAGIKAEFSIPGDHPEIPMTSEQRRNLFLVVKESLHNVVKHSGATVVKLSLDVSDNKLEIIIDDNGKGFDKNRSLLSGNGLINMQKRIESLGGSFFIDSLPGRGTRITFSVFL
jgi:signal transduction histidine kinase